MIKCQNRRRVVIRKCILWILTIIWMLLIFGFSAQPATESTKLSESISSTVSEKVLAATSIPPWKHSPILTAFHIAVRKTAHFLIFAVLGMLVFLLLQSYDLSFWKAFFWMAWICMLYAVSDEIHQLFSDGRSCRVLDVILDTIGSACGALIVHFATMFLTKFRKRKCSGTK